MRTQRFLGTNPGVPTAYKGRLAVVVVHSNEDKLSSSYQAAMDGQKAVVKLLLGAANIHVALRDADGRTSLSCAAVLGHPSVVALLLASSAVDLNSKDKEGLAMATWR